MHLWQPLLKRAPHLLTRPSLPDAHPAQAFRLVTTRGRAKAAMCTAALAHWQGHTASSAFVQWRCAAAGTAARAGRADAHFGRARRRSALVAWRRQARRQALLAQCGLLLAEKSASTLLRAHLRAWLAATQRRCEGRDKVQHCLAALAIRHAAAALRQWRHWAAQQQERQARAAACLQRMLQWRLAAAWGCWRSRVAACRDNRARLERSIALLR